MISRGYFMTVGRVAPLEPVQNKSAGRVGQASKNVQGDSVSISPEAKSRAELNAALDIVSSVPDVRTDRVAELKAKINDPNYLTEAIISATADKLIDTLYA